MWGYFNMSRYTHIKTDDGVIKMETVVKDTEIRYFIPVADKYFNTSIGHYIVSATVEKDNDPRYHDIYIFDTLNVVEPQEIKDKWPSFNRQGFMEVKGVEAGKLEEEQFIELYEQCKKRFNKREEQ